MAQVEEHPQTGRLSCVKPKGSQFQQLTLFNKGPATAQPPKAVNSDTKLSDHKQFVQKFGSAPEGRWSWMQEELPHGMPEREYGDGPTSGTSNYEWVPTWNMETEQPSISPDKFLDRFTGMNYNKSAKREGQENLTGTYSDNPVTMKYPGQAQGGEDLHVLMDGNHRISAERHRGAMFHRVNAYESTPDRLSPPRT